MTIAELYSIYLKHPIVTTDSRKIPADSIFFALKGDNFNGNNYALQALENGASYAVVDEPVATNNNRILQFNDVLSTLQALAKHHREQFNCPVIAITGSNAKTTTKELVHATLNTTYTTYTTEGNLNNHIGIPLTLLKVKNDAKIIVIEMGANHQKEIAGYCQYVLPTHGLITNCGKAHLEGFGGVEGIKKGKGELFDYLRATNGTCFIFNDYDYLVSMSKGIKNIITYGTANANYVGNVVNDNTEFIAINYNNQTINTKLVGNYNLPNLLAALTIGLYFNVEFKKIKNALENYQPSNSRSQLIKKGSNTIILDAYNANPSSMQLAVENFGKINHHKKMVFLGAMKELGDDTKAEHENLVKLLEQLQLTNVVLVGSEFLQTTHGFTYFSTAEAATDWLKQQSITDSYILIKGSRSTKMETVLEAL
jgi:UDP-N-acetylmuramoyl-tripeptide--D-alanyl-D-alanine ligase